MRRQEEAHGKPDQDEGNGSDGASDPPVMAARGCDRHNRGQLSLASLISIRPANGRKEPVATARHSLYKRGILSGISQGIAQAPDRGIQAVVEVDIGIGRPEAVAQFLPSNDLAGAVQKFGEYLKRLLLQLDLGPIPAELSCVQIEFKNSEPTGRRGSVAVCAPHSRQVQHSDGSIPHIIPLCKCLTRQSLACHPRFIGR
jgi:hypothetical protein